MNFQEYEENVRKMGRHSGAYRDLELNFIQYNRTPYSAPDIFNLFYCANNSHENPKRLNKPLHIGETFNLATAYLGTYLHRRGFTFDYIQAFQYEKKALAEKLSRGNILTIAIITTLYVSPFPIMEMMEFIKSYNREAKIIIGGPFVSTQARTQDKMELQYTFKSIGADFYVNSPQGETALVKIIHSLKNNLAIENIENIYYKTPKGYAATPVSKEDNKLSENMVNWELFANRPPEYVNIRTSISCPFSCSFCGFPQHAGPYQTAGIQDIETELNGLVKANTVKSIQFIDDTFNVPIKRFKKLLRMMIKNKYRFRWHSHFRCQYTDEEMIRLMKESGCEGVFLGIESGSETILENMNKKASLDKYLQGIQLLKKYNILTYGSFIIGFPGETEETVRETIGFIEKSGLDFFRAQLWYCDTITPIWKEKEKYRIKGSHFQWSHMGMDSQKAAQLVDHIFLSIRQPLWVPQYNFEFDGLFHLLHRGMTLVAVKGFISSFNNGIKTKLQHPANREIDFRLVEEIRKYCQGNPFNDNPNTGNPNVGSQYGEGFDF